LDRVGRRALLHRQGFVFEEGIHLLLLESEILLSPLIVEQVMAALSVDQQLAVAKRLGWMNIYNPDFPDHYFDCNLRVPDERRMVELLVKMAVSEAVSLVAHFHQIGRPDVSSKI